MKEITIKVTDEQYEAFQHVPDEDWEDLSQVILKMAQDGIETLENYEKVGHNINGEPLLVSLTEIKDGKEWALYQRRENDVYEISWLMWGKKAVYRYGEQNAFWGPAPVDVKSEFEPYKSFLPEFVQELVWETKND